MQEKGYSFLRIECLRVVALHAKALVCPWWLLASGSIHGKVVILAIEIYLFICLAVPGLNCCMQDLQSLL